MIIPDLEHIKEHGKIYTGRYIKIHYPEFYEHLQQYSGEKITEKMWRYFYGNPDGCIVCGKPTKFLNFNTGYSQTCCIQCSGKNPSRMSKASVTKLKKYGDAHYNNRAKMKETCEERYGGVGLASAEIKERAQQTCEERYGISNVSSITRDKAKKTCLEKYGGVGLASTEIKERVQRTCMERYGVKNPFESSKIQNQIKQTNLKHYGTENIGSVTRDRAGKTCKERYGGIGFNSKLTNDKIQQTSIERYGSEIFCNREKALNTMMERYGYDNWAIAHAMEHHDDLIEIKDGDWYCTCPHPECTQCIEKIYKTRNQIHNDRKRNKTELCTKLNPIGSSIKYVSSISQKIAKELDKLLGMDSQYHVRGGEKQVGSYHLDYFIPELNIAVEFNGDYWHANPKLYSEDWYNPVIRMTAREIWRRDADRIKQIESHGIKVFVLWEHDYINDKDAINNLIKQIKEPQ